MFLRYHTYERYMRLYIIHKIVYTDLTFQNLVTLRNLLSIICILVFVLYKVDNYDQRDIIQSSNMLCSHFHELHHYISFKQIYKNLRQLNAKC